MVSGIESDVDWIERLAVTGCDLCTRAVLAARSAARSAADDPRAAEWADDTVGGAVEYMVNHVYAWHGVEVETYAPSTREVRTLAAVAAAFDTLAENIGELGLDLDVLDRVRGRLGTVLAAVPTALIGEMRDALAYAPPPLV